jgi:hypothetical protein
VQGRVEAVLEPDVDPLDPELAAQLRPADDLAGCLEQPREQHEGLALQGDTLAAAPERERFEVRLEGAETPQAHRAFVRHA